MAKTAAAIARTSSILMGDCVTRYASTGDASLGDALIELKAPIFVRERASRLSAKKAPTARGLRRG